MAVTVTERFGSRDSTEGDSPSVELLFNVWGTANDITAKSNLLAASPLLYDGLVRQSASVEQVGPELWEGSVQYGRRKREEETGDSNYQFETGGGTQHITQSIQTRGRYAPAGENAPDFKGAIGATKDGVEGVDVTTPQYNFSETHYLPVSIVTPAYKATLFSLTGRKNASPFRGFAAGEVLFLGARGSQRGEEDWEVNFNFSASPNVTDLAINDITVAEKRGWDYLWVLYETAEDGDAKKLVKRPIAAYVEEVHYDGEFSLLKIG